MKQNENRKQPFFAKFLEAQQTAETNEQNRQGAAFNITTKIWDDLEHTQKYPSDNDEDILAF